MSIFHSGYDPQRIYEICNKKGARIHFVGAGGIGMYPVMALMLDGGGLVSGSDARGNVLTEDLLSRGAKIKIGSAPELSELSELVVYTLALSERDPDVRRAESLGIPTASRAEFLGALMMDYSSRIGISGSHGKSTVTAMTDAIFSQAGRGQTTVVGAHLRDTGLPLRIGSKETLIYEACEYKDSFLRFSPTAAVYTSLELDHTDYFRDIEALKSSFRASITSCPLPVISSDDERLSEICSGIKKKCVTYGAGKGDVCAAFTRREDGRYSIKIRHASGTLPEIMLKVPGKYNAENALAAAALSLSLGVCEDAVCRGLSDFPGLSRRMEYIGEANGNKIFYDYAHHPTEIAAAIKGIKESERLPVTVIFKPHTFSRTRDFLLRFAAALSLADRVILLDIDPVREIGDGRITSLLLAKHVSPPVTVASESEAARLSLSGIRSCVVLMGAGEVGYVHKELKDATRVSKKTGNAEE